MARNQSVPPAPPGPVPRPGANPVFDQQTMLIITTAQANFQNNAAAARNQLTGTLSALTLNVQQANMSGLKQLTSHGPLEAAANDDLLAAQRPGQFAALNAAAGVPPHQATK